LALGVSRSDLSFGDKTSFAIEKSSIVVGSDFVLNDHVSFEIAAGALMNGSLRLTSGKSLSPIRALGPGWLGAFSASWTVVKQHRYVPYFVLSTTLAATRARTRTEPLANIESRGSVLGTDFRFGATLGETFWNVMSPYLALRVFGGPVFLTDASKTQIGSDNYHVQPAIGAVVLCGKHVDIFAEGAPVLERSLTIGLGIRR
jgi:hypothetical protein